MEKIGKLCIEPKASVNSALKQMDASAEKILFVVNKENKLLGTITDGDIRRWILKGRTLNAAISLVMNPSPYTVREGFLADEAQTLMLDHKIECLPVINAAGVVISALRWVDLFNQAQSPPVQLNIPLVIMAGGEGKRLAPFTKVLPKPLLPIGEQPIISLIIDRFSSYGCNKVYLSVNYKADIIKAYFDNFKHKYKIAYVREKKPLGTAGSLSLLKGKIKSTFFVSNCDILVNTDYAELVRYHQENGHLITLVGSMRQYIIPYGICELNKKGSLTGLREKPEYNFLANTGLYVLEPEALNKIPKNKIYHLTDLVMDAIKHKEKVGVYPVSEKAWMDMGQWESLQEMIKNLEV